VAQGGRYHRQAGRHFNPHTYFDIKTIRTHSHFAAAFSGAMIYLGDNFPEKYRNQIFMNNIHANKVHADWLERKGSGFLGKFGPHDAPVKGGRSILPHDQRGAGFVDSGDKWYRGLCLRTGPDGSVFVNDWYDQRPCHQLRPHDQDMNFKSGRIYKISHGEPSRVTDLNLARATDAQLVEYQLHHNDWYARTARRLLQERGESGSLKPDTRKRLTKIASTHSDPTRRLRGIWALHATGGIDHALGKELLVDENEYVRAWAIQCAAEDGRVEDSLCQRFVDMAKNDLSPVVRLYLASACHRLPLEQRWTILEELIAHADDAKDQNLPQIYWYALEPLCPADRTRALQLAAKCQIPVLRQHIARRVAAAAE